MEVNNAISSGLALPWALIRELSCVTLGSTPAEINKDELLEACFFSPTEEVQIWREDGKRHSAMISDEEGDKAIVKQYRIESPEFGYMLETKRYVAFDEDGQAFVAGSRLCGWREEKENE